jgi:hypothetical protein
VKKLFLAVAIAAAAVFPTGALAGTFSGVVVGNAGGNLAVASKSGVVRSVHTRAQPRLGTRVRVSGTSVRSVGVARSARVHGVIVNRAHGVTFVAAGRNLIAIRSRSGRRLASSGPASGAVVTTNVAIGNGQLTQQSMTVTGSANAVTIQAPVTAVGAGTITVTINGQSLTIQLPAGIQLPASLVGQTVTLKVTLSVSGSPTAEEADETDGDNNDNQGDNNDNQGDNNDDDNGGGDD